MKPKALVIEPEEIICKSIADNLEVIGLDVNFTTNFDSALYLLEVNKYDCIIIEPLFIDYSKNEMTYPGIDLIKKVRKK